MKFHLKMHKYRLHYKGDPKYRMLKAWDFTWISYFTQDFYRGKGVFNVDYKIMVVVHEN